MLKILFKLQTEGCHTEVPTARWHVNCGLKLFFWPYKEYIRKCTYSNLHVSCSVLLYSPCGGCRILILNKTSDHGNVVHVLWQFFSDFSKFCLKFDVQFQGTRRKKTFTTSFWTKYNISWRVLILQCSSLIVQLAISIISTHHPKNRR